MSIQPSSGPAHSRLRYSFVFFLLLATCGIGALYAHVLYEKKRLLRTQDAMRTFFLTHATDFWDENEYLIHNQDVALAIRSGHYAESAWHHFENYGLTEGRFFRLRSPSSHIHTETAILFKHYLNHIEPHSGNKPKSVLALMNWFSGISVRCTPNTEIELAQRQRAPIRKLPLHEVVYLLYNKQYAMLCGNYAYFFSRILNQAGYQAVDYNIGLEGDTHVVTLVNLSEKDDDCYTLWDSYYNFYIVDKQGLPACMSQIYQVLNEFYTRKTPIPLQLVRNNVSEEQHLLHIPTLTYALPESFQTRDNPLTGRDADLFLFGTLDCTEADYLQRRMPMLIHKDMGDLFILNLLPFPIGKHNKTLANRWLQKYPDLPSLIKDHLQSRLPPYRTEIIE